MLNKSQYKVLKNVIKQINILNPEKPIISNWQISSFDLSIKEKNTLMTINFTPIEDTLLKFKGFFGDMFKLDSVIINQMNEYEEKHNWKTSSVVIITTIGTIIGILIGILTAIALTK
jgi:uncharacterized protein YacL